MGVTRLVSELFLAGALLCALGPVLVACDTDDAVAGGRYSELIVVARLDDIVQSPACGGFHFGSVARYTVVEVIEGKYEGAELHVVHGCPELSRAGYGSDSGSLDAFRAGDVHRMVLTTDSIHQIGSVVKPEGLEPGTIYYCRHVALHDVGKAFYGNVPANMTLKTDGHAACLRKPRARGFAPRYADN